MITYLVYNYDLLLCSVESILKQCSSTTQLIMVMTIIRNFLLESHLLKLVNTAKVNLVH